MFESQNRRKYERHSINENKFLVIGGMQVLIDDISWGGLCGHTAQAVNGEVQVNGGTHGTAARILACEFMGDAAIDPAYPYQVRCQFLSAPGSPDIEHIVNFVIE